MTAGYGLLHDHGSRCARQAKVDAKLKSLRTPWTPPLAVPVICVHQCASVVLFVRSQKDNTASVFIEAAAAQSAELFEEEPAPARDAPGAAERLLKSPKASDADSARRHASADAAAQLVGRRTPSGGENPRGLRSRLKPPPASKRRRNRSRTARYLPARSPQPVRPSGNCSSGGSPGASTDGCGQAKRRASTRCRCG